MQHNKQQILDIMDQYGPKHFAKKIKNTPELYEIVSDYPGDTVSEQVYNFLNPGNHVCHRGNKKVFNSITNGYRFCGKAGSCLCAKESVSQKCKESKESYTDDEKKIIQEKRVNTTMLKYGVTNNGQIEKAIQTRKELYSNQETVDALTKKVKQTKLERYGNENYNNIEKIKEKLSSKRTPEYWAELLNNDQYTKLHDKEYMAQLIYDNSPHEMADMLNVHVQTIYRHLAIHGIREPYKSYAELELIGFFNSLGIYNIIRNTRKLLKSGKEIDLYLPDFNLAIEYNGVYWHNEDIPHITKTYHWEKHNECASMGIQLITIFSTVWLNNKDIVKKMLTAKLKLNTESVFARKCSIREVKSSEIKEFLKANHIQGYTVSSINYALVYDDKIVSVMTFGKCSSRIGIGKSEDGYELIRYATSIRVVGGASKLLRHFIKEHSPNKIVSYSNNEWSDGNMYNTLGFSLETEVKPSYFYVSANGTKMYHRFKFSKQKLVRDGHDSRLTERQITKQLKLLRIWDCGKKRWVLNF